MDDRFDERETEPQLTEDGASWPPSIEFETVSGTRPESPLVASNVIGFVLAFAFPAAVVWFVGPYLSSLTGGDADHISYVTTALGSHVLEGSVAFLVRREFKKHLGGFWIGFMISFTLMLFTLNSWTL